MRRIMISVSVLTTGLASCFSSALPETVRDKLLAGPNPERLWAYHDVLASQPHDAGTPGDAAVIDALAGWFESFGLEVEKQELHLYLSTPVSASVSIVDPEGGERLELPLREKAVEGDPYSTDDRLRPGWNAYSGSGTVEAGVVYANYGRLEDFERLEQLGVDPTGKIVIARYGGNYRGYKARFAEEAGAAGLIMYTDPANSGWGRGLPWPEGGYANETHIQRGSIKTLPYHGDPLTPFVESTADAERLDPADVALPTIPVQPISWEAAEQILERMTGAEVPGGWQGGLPMRYRLTGGEELRVRLQVEQTRGMVVTHNVMGTLRGSTHPDEVVIIGGHHDAWGFGASDPGAGLICVVEAARVLGEMAQQGWRPARSIVFAGWGAEEHGIVGSVEYVESRPEWLRENAVAYLNLDMSAMGPNFRSAASPSLQGVIAEAARLVPQPGGAEGETVWHRWTGTPTTLEFDLNHAGFPADTIPAFGTLGGGSDHIGFLCHTCIPSAALGGRGARGTSYHSIYDNLAWYRAVVGDDYEPARMVTQMTLLTAALLAEHAESGFTTRRYAEETLKALDRIEHGADDDDDWVGFLAETHQPIRDAARSFAEASAGLSAHTHFPGLLDELGGRSFRSIDRADATALLRGIERSWCDPAFDDGRPWYRNGFAGPDATSGYAAWVLTGLRGAVQDGDRDRYAEQARQYEQWFRDNTRRIENAIDSANAE